MQSRLNNCQIKIRLAEIDSPEKPRPSGGVCLFAHFAESGHAFFGYDRFQCPLCRPTPVWLTPNIQRLGETELGQLGSACFEYLPAVQHLSHLNIAFQAQARRVLFVELKVKRVDRYDNHGAIVFYDRTL